MELNSIIFPSPKSSYNVEEYKGELIWIPRKQEFNYKDQIKYNNYKSLIPNQKTTKTKESGSVHKIPKISFSFENKFEEIKVIEKEEYIPCIFHKSSNSNNIVLYFHANYEDIGHTYSFIQNLSISLKLNILAVEYPSYGVYSSSVCNADRINEDAHIMYKFLTDIMNIKENNIILMGRCLGSGPATYLASLYNPNSLILISPFTSIKDAVKSIFGNTILGWIANKLVSERLINK